MELIGNVIWPTLLLYTSFARCFYLVILTIGIEMLPIYYLVQGNIKSSAILSVVGNLISGTIGFFILTLLYGAVHFQVVKRKKLKRKYTFKEWLKIIFIGFCIGSIVIEVMSCYFIFDYSLGSLILPLAIGNIISYTLTYFIERNFLHKKTQEMFGGQERP